LLIAGIAAVLLTGGGLVVAMVAFDGDGPAVGPDDPPSSGPATTAPTEVADPATSAPPSPRPAGDPTCLHGSWRATELEEALLTGDLVLIDGGPVFTYRDDGTGTIEFGEGTRFEFHPFFGSITEQEVTGTVEFEYAVRDGEVVHTYLNPLDGATMHLGDLGDFPYVPGADTLTYQCGDGVLTLVEVDVYRAELERAS